MPDDKTHTKKIYLMLLSNGGIVLDKDYLWDGCDTPELDPDIEMPPITIRKLCELVSERYLETAEADDVERLKKLLSEMTDSRDIIEQTLKKIEAQFA